MKLIDIQNKVKGKRKKLVILPNRIQCIVKKFKNFQLNWRNKFKSISNWLGLMRSLLPMNNSLHKGLVNLRNR